MVTAMESLLLLPIILPIVTGIGMLISSFLDHIRAKEKAVVSYSKKEQKKIKILAGSVLLLSVAAALFAAWSGEKSITLFYLMEDLPIYFQIDALGRLFVTFLSIVWLAAGIYSFLYMEHEGEEKRFFGFYLVVYGVLVAQDFAGNLITLYLFYELMTLTAMPLVMHNGTKEAIMAGLKYLFYSVCGAYLSLFAIFFLYQNCDTLTFTAGGTLNQVAAEGNQGILRIAAMCMIIGFGAKAGLFPLHAWLPTAHPVAPAPASAVLSSIIVKSGVLSIIRGIFYIVGADFIRGTWVQTAWMILALVTVFMGSMLAYREKVFKKRLAYSTVSQVSYILFGLSLLSAEGMTGALLHTVCHAFIKCALFLTAGIFIFRTGKSSVDEYRGIGKKMPFTLWCYTFTSLALIGIPPTSGFISKWYLAQGALQTDVGVFSYLGPVVLLISALLTAGYLLPITMNGFFPGKEDGTEVNTALTLEEADVRSGTSKEKIDKMSAMLFVLVVFAVVIGILPNPLVNYVREIGMTLMP